uniref:Uncharacterized protein n=1 Tax=Avena sativa TaxID=4498 RepID=A0ACD5Y415_AVESA
MESITAHNQSPATAGVEAREGSVPVVRHPGIQAEADAAEGAVVGAEAIHGSVFGLRHPGSGLIPGRIPGRPPLRHLGRLVPATAVGSSAVRAKPQKKNTTTGCADLAMSVPSSSNPQAADEVEGGNVLVDISDDDDGEEEDVEVEAVGPKRRKLTSAVWKQFKRVKIGEKWKAKCVHCSKKLGGETKNGTKHLHDHLRSCVYVKIKNRGKTLAQSSLRFNSQDQGKISVENYTFDQEFARKELSNMVVLHEYPLCMVDHTGFRRFVTALQPLFKMVTRNTIRKDIFDNYKEERKKAMEYMAANRSRVAITTDMWTSDNQKKGYMAITAHFIDDNWNLRSVVMRFIYVPAPHTAEVIAEQLYESLVAWNLDEKLSAVTVDNCTSNDKAIHLLVKQLGTEKLMLKGIMLHMRCSAHILNLIVKDGLDVMRSAIEKIRESVAFWTATPKRVEKFEEIAKFQKVKIEKMLALDCKTRWNSTFTMLNTALPYKAVFERAKKVEKLYDSLPSDDEWAFASDVVKRLELFFEVTELFSGTDYVTANIYFPKICEIKEKMRLWATCGDATIEAMTISMNAKFDKYWTDIQGLMSMATLLDPRYKNEMLLVCFSSLHGVNPEECHDLVREVIASLCTLLEEYEASSEDNVESSNSSRPASTTTALMSVFSARIAQKRPATFRTELDQYLVDDLVSLTKEHFDVLDWWKVAGRRYPTLRKVARDIFAIPVTTVASESAFSTSGRVLSEHRSRLASDMLEALMCSQDWLRNKYKYDRNGDAASFWSCLQDIQEGLQDLEL